MAEIDKITARPFRRNVKAFTNLLEAMNIESIKDIPTRKEVVEKITAGSHTARDVWFAKMYQSGINLRIANQIRQGKYDVPENIKTILYHMQEAFPEVKGNKETPAGAVETITSHQNRIENYFSRKFIDIEEEVRDLGGTSYTTLTNVVKSTITKGLPFTKAKVKKIFAHIENINDYDAIMKKIFRGIAEIPDREMREFVLINLLGTRGDQNLAMVASKTLATDLSPPRAWYNREIGNITGTKVQEGKKPLPANVPLGPYLRDMMDQRYDRMTDNGRLAGSVGLWDDLPENINLGNIIDTYVFQKTEKNPRGIFTERDIELLGRPGKNEVPGGFTDLRRLTLAWNARKTGKRGLADELLGHGKKEISEGAEMVSKVGSEYYLPGAPTPVDNLRAFNTALEQNIAKLLGHENYLSLEEDFDVLGVATVLDAAGKETEVIGNYINDVKKFTNQTIIPPRTTDRIDIDEIKPKEIEYTGESSEIREAREDLRVQQLQEQSGEANFQLYQKAIAISKQLKIPFDEAFAMIEDKRNVKRPPKIPPRGREILDNVKRITGASTDVTKKVHVGEIVDQVPATQADIDDAAKQTGANPNTKDGRTKIRNFLKGFGKYLPVISGIVGGVTAYSTLGKDPESFAAQPITEGPYKGKLDLVDQTLAAFGADTGKERQRLRAGYEAFTGFWPRSLQPPSGILIPTEEEKKAQEEHHKEVSNFLADEGPLGP